MTAAEPCKATSVPPCPTHQALVRSRSPNRYSSQTPRVGPEFPGYVVPLQQRQEQSGPRAGQECLAQNIHAENAIGRRVLTQRGEERERLIRGRENRRASGIQTVGRFRPTRRPRGPESNPCPGPCLRTEPTCAGSLRVPRFSPFSPLEAPDRPPQTTVLSSRPTAGGRDGCPYRPRYL